MQLASGDVPVKYETLPGGFRGTDATVARMRAAAMGRYGARSPKIRALAINILRQHNIPEKNYTAEAVAMGEWVRDNIRYVKDVYGQETLSYPEELAFNSRAGDCLDGETLLLTPRGLKPLKDIKVGETIRGRNGWVKVTQTWDKGVLPTKTYSLNNGGAFTATDDHLCILDDGEEVPAGELGEGSCLLSPKQIDFQGKGKLLPPDCYLIGLFISDGWKDDKKICISGKDGFPKEEQKRWVKQYCQLRGWKYHWHPRYITIYPDGYIGDVLYGMECMAKSKCVPDEVWSDLTPEAATELLRGIMADSYDPEHLFTSHTNEHPVRNGKKRRGGLCFGSISDRLAIQVRMLFKSIGISVRDTLVFDHGGLGDHPIHRVYPRMYRHKPVVIDSIEPAGNLHVYDIETEDHGIYLPEADVVVHNCDDKSTLLAALLGSIGIPSRFKVMGTTPMQYSHVYLQARPKNAWITMDTIMRDKPIGWEVPANRQLIQKVYPVNAPVDTERRGANMSGLGYVGDPRVESHLESPTIPMGAGKGMQPPRAAGAPAYVSMPSGLDTDADVAPLAAHPPNANIGHRYPAQRAVDMSPQQMRLTNAGVRPAAQASQLPGMDGFYDVQGPMELAGLVGAVPPEDMAVPAYMQTKTVRQAPEGVDALYARASLVVDPKKGDKIEYYGDWSRAEKPPIRRYENVAGMDESMPGMGAPLPADAAVAGVSPTQVKTTLGLAVAAIAGYFIYKKMR